MGQPLPAEASVLRRLALIWHTYQWYAIGILSLLTLALGWIGIRRYCGGMPVPLPAVCVSGLTRWDVLYLSLQLFIWQSGSLFLGADVDGTLQAARLLAPALLGYATVRALIALFSDHYQLVRARLSSDHVVICGLGGLGTRLAERFRASGTRVVMIERDQHNPAVRSARVHGAVLTDDATEWRVLKKAGVERAREVIAVCGSDVVNARVAARLLARLSGNARRLTCYVHVSDAALWDFLRVREVESDSDGGRLQFFNAHDLAARSAVPALFPDGEISGQARPLHLLIVGVGPIAERLVVQTCRTWQAVRANSTERFRCSVVAPDATRIVKAFSDRYPRFDDVCEFTVYDLDPVSREFQTLLPAGGRITAACVSASSDASALSAGLALFHRSRNDAFPIMICATQERGLDVFLGSADGDSSSGRLMLFATAERCTPELVLNGTNEILARAIHEAYLRDQARNGHTVHTNPTMRPWDELDTPLKGSNREQADHIVQKLSAIGCGVNPLDRSHGTLLQFTRDEIEYMAKMEHSRWRNERRKEGWHYDAEQKNLERKTSPHLTDWEKLGETVKEYNRNTVREIPAFLARVGLAVYRRQANDQPTPHRAESPR